MNWKEHRLRILEHLTFENSIYSESNHVYRLTHYYDQEPRTCYIEANILPGIMDALIAFIQFEMAENEEEYRMDQTEVIAILKQFYNVKDSTSTESIEVDLYFNWEKWCGAAIEIMDVKLFHRVGLKEKLKQMYDEGKNQEVS